MACDELPSAGEIASELHRGLDCFGAGISEEASPRFAVRHQGFQFFCKLRHLGVIKIGSRHVNQGFSLFLYGAHDIGMAMSRRANGNAGTEVQETIAIHVFDNGASSTLCHEGI
jgi:hypothetical protein